MNTNLTSTFTILCPKEIGIAPDSLDLNNFEFVKRSEEENSKRSYNGLYIIKKKNVSWSELNIYFCYVFYQGYYTHMIFIFQAFASGKCVYL